MCCFFSFLFSNKKLKPVPMVFSFLMTFLVAKWEIDRKHNVNSQFGLGSYMAFGCGIIHLVSVVLGAALSIRRGNRHSRSQVILRDSSTLRPLALPTQKEDTENLTPPTPVYLHRLRTIPPTPASSTQTEDTSSDSGFKYTDRGFEKLPHTPASSTQTEDTESIPAPPIYLLSCPPPHYEDVIADRGLQNSQHPSLPAVAPPSYDSVTSGGHSSSTFIQLDIRLLEMTPHYL